MTELNQNSDPYDLFIASANNMLMVQQPGDARAEGYHNSEVMVHAGTQLATVQIDHDHVEPGDRDIFAALEQIQRQPQGNQLLVTITALAFKELAERE